MAGAVEMQGVEYQAHVRTSLLMRSTLLECPSPSFILFLDDLPKRQTLLFRVSPNMRWNLSQFYVAQLLLPERSATAVTE